MIDHATTGDEAARKPGEERTINENACENFRKELFQEINRSNSSHDRSSLSGLECVPPPPEKCLELVGKLGDALQSGNVKELQDLLKGIKTPEDLKNLKQAAQYLSKLIPDIQIKVGVDEWKDDQPYLTITKSHYNPNIMCGGGNSSETLVIDKDSASATFDSDIGINPTRNRPIDVEAAMKAIQKSFADIKLDRNDSPRYRGETQSQNPVPMHQLPGLTIHN